MENDFIMKPKVDFCFKELLYDPVVRQGFLAAILGVNPETITETELLPTHLRKEHKEDKLGILDVRVVLKDETQIDVEMQVTAFAMWPERSLFYLAKLYVEQLQEGEDYDKLKKCIHIGILNFELFPEEKDYYSRFHILEDNRKEKYTDKLEIHIFELPKLEKHQYPETELLNWMRFMNAEKKEEFMMLAEKDEYIEKAYERLTKISADQQKRLEYEAREKAVRDYNWQMKTCRRDGFNKGYKDGYDSGYGSGYDSGKKEGEILAAIKTCQKFSVSKEATKLQLKEEYSLEDEVIENYMKLYWS